MRIAVPLVDTAALLDNLVNLGLAHSRGVIVGGLGRDGRSLAAIAAGQALGVLVLGDDGRGLAGGSRRKLGPEVINGILWRLGPRARLRETDHARRWSANGVAPATR